MRVSRLSGHYHVPGVGHMLTLSRLEGPGSSMMMHHDGLAAKPTDSGRWVRTSRGNLTHGPQSVGLGVNTSRVGASPMRILSRRYWPALALLVGCLALVPAGPGRGDLIFLKDGFVLQGKVR